MRLSVLRPRVISSRGLSVCGGGVEAVDVFEEGYLDLLTGLPMAAPDQLELGLERLEEAFDVGIVVTIAFSARRDLEAVLAQQLVIIVGAVLRPAIRVMDASRWRRSDGDCYAQGPQGQILLHAVADQPADHAPREKVNDHGKINQALARPDIGDGTSPLLVRPARSEVLLQEIRRDVERMVTVGGAFERPAADDLDAVLAHQTASAVLADADAQLFQLLGHARPAVAAQAQPVLVADMGEEHHVAPLATRWRPMLHSMKPML